MAEEIMIRFVDMRRADIEGYQFAFWNTVTNKFIKLAGDEAFEDWDNFIESYNLEYGLDDGPIMPPPLGRFENLCPIWVFKTDHFRK